MKFRTEYIAHPSPLRLTPDRPLAMLGSCFADYMGARLRSCLWQAENPCGVLFNPLSIAGTLRLLIDSRLNPALCDNRIEASLFQSRGLANSWLADSSFSSTSAGNTHARIQDSLIRLDALLSSGQALIVTFGTAWCYFLADNPSYVVANCHKQPSSLFDRRMVDVDTIHSLWRELLADLKKLYPNLNVVFTVSPVRHVRDGLAENSRSKATLLLAADRICRDFDWCDYFASYEILLDDLRDYRFYDSDLVHPSQMAVDYIKEKFCDTYLGDAQLDILDEGESLARRLSHRPLHPELPEASDFALKSRILYDDFAARHPNCLRVSSFDEV